MKEASSRRGVEETTAISIFELLKKLGTANPGSANGPLSFHNKVDAKSALLPEMTSTALNESELVLEIKGHNETKLHIAGSFVLSMAQE